MSYDGKCDRPGCRGFSCPYCERCTTECPNMQCIRDQERNRAMAETIFKYEINERVRMPKGAKPISVGTQGAMMVWCIVDPAADLTWHYFDVRGTGHPLPDDLGTFIGTVFQDSFVWHIFDDGEM